MPSKRRAVSCYRREYLIAFALIGCVGCSTPLQKAIGDLAPAYEPKRPATNEAELGRHMAGDQPATNRCFYGREAKETFKSWDRADLEYKYALHGDLKADFGATVKATATIGPKTGVRVTLKDVSMERLDTVFFNADDQCNRFVDADEYLRGKDERVITRALRAQSIEIRKASETGIGLELDAKVEATIGSQTQSSASYSGAKLFVAHYLERLRVRRREARDRVATPNGPPIDLGTCGFTLTAIQSAGWEGRIDCQGGSRAVKGPINGFDNWNSGSGVTYAVRVRRDGVARGRVDFFEVVVESRR